MNCEGPCEPELRRSSHFARLDMGRAGGDFVAVQRARGRRTHRMAAGDVLRRVAAGLVALLALAVAGAHDEGRAAGEKGTFLHVSDIHFDPFATPGAAAELLRMDVDRWRARLLREPDQTMAGFGRDTNFPLLDS